MLRLLKRYYPVRNAIFVVCEGGLIFLSVFVALWLQETHGVSGQLHEWAPLKITLITFICLLCLYYNDLYDIQVTDSFPELGIRLLQALGAAAILLAGLYLLFPGLIIGRSIFLVSSAILIVMIVSWRFCYSQVLSRGLFDQKIILLGFSELARDIENEISSRRDSGYKIEAIFTGKKIAEDLKNPHYCYIQHDTFENICELAHSRKIRKIVVTLNERRGCLPVKELLRCRVNGIEVIEGNSFFEMLTGKLIVKQINPGWLIFSEGFQKSWLQRTIKRSVDLVLSIFMLIALSPLFALVALLIKLESPGPIFFSQERVGKRRRPYLIYKFRSMCDNAEALTGPVWACNDDDRITRVGRFIRKWRIDEFPQLWNVLKGNMSFVGPRPEREHFVKELIEIIPYYGERFSVKPGVTGWAQVNYGYGASVEDAIEKLNYDLFYIKNLSIFMDLLVIMKTVKTVMFGEGAR